MWALLTFYAITMHSKAHFQIGYNLDNNMCWRTLMKYMKDLVISTDCFQNVMVYITHRNKIINR